MSWQGYVDQQLLGTGFVNKAAIIGLNGGVWAQSAGFALSPEEAATIANQANGLPGSVLGEGATPVVIGGTKYMVLRADDNVFYVRQGADGACIAKTNQAVLLGMYGDGMQPGNCNVTVEKLADYLKESNY